MSIVSCSSLGSGGARARATSTRATTSVMTAALAWTISASSPGTGEPAVYNSGEGRRSLVLMMIIFLPSVTVTLRLPGP